MKINYINQLHRDIIVGEIGRDEPQEHPKQENCCTPIGQIKRYVDCVGCDRKPKQEQEICNHCGKTLREQMKGCGEITCYRQFLPKQETTLEEAAKSNYDNKTAKIPVPTSHWINSEFLQIQNFKEGAKWQSEKMYSEEDMIEFAEFVASYPDKNRNIHGDMLHAKSKYDGSERTIDLLQIWFKQFKKKA